MQSGSQQGLAAAVEGLRDLVRTTGLPELLAEFDVSQIPIAIEEGLLAGIELHRVRSDRRGSRAGDRSGGGDQLEGRGRNWGGGQAAAESEQRQPRAREARAGGHGRHHIIIPLQPFIRRARLPA